MQLDEVPLGEEPGVLIVCIVHHDHQRGMRTLRRVALVLRNEESAVRRVDVPRNVHVQALLES